MNAEIRKNKDFWAGLMFIGIGAGAIFIARDYRFGSALQMGPGFFPVVLGGILIVFGIAIMVTGLRSKEKIQEPLSIRALIMLPLSMILFGQLMVRAGFIPAVVLLIFASAAAGREFKVGEVLSAAIVLTVGTAALFIWGLELPYPLLKGF